MFKIIEIVTDNFINIIWRILAGLLIIFFGIKIINIFIIFIRKQNFMKKLDKTVLTFLVSFLNIFLKISVFILVAFVLGANATSIITIIGSASLAIGLALQGGLSNLAGGLILLLFKPFIVGNIISVKEYTGKVSAITLFHSVLTTDELKKIYIPNSVITSNLLINYSITRIKRIDLIFYTKKDSDINKTKEVMKEVIINNEIIVDKEKYFISLKESTMFYQNVLLQVWIKNEDYKNSEYIIIEEVEKKLIEHNLK